jgi:hypothetical protein
MKVKQILCAFIIICSCAPEPRKRADPVEIIEDGVKNFDINAVDWLKIIEHSTEQLISIYNQQVDLNESYKTASHVFDNIIPLLCNKVNDLRATCATNVRIKSFLQEGDNAALSCQKYDPDDPDEPFKLVPTKIIKSIYIALEGGSSDATYKLRAKQATGAVYNSQLLTAKAGERKKVVFTTEFAAAKLPPRLGELSEIALVNTDPNSNIENSGLTKVALYVSDPNAVSSASAVLGGIVKTGDFIYPAQKNELHFPVIKLIEHALSAQCRIADSWISSETKVFNDHLKPETLKNKTIKKSKVIGATKDFVLEKLAKERKEVKLNEKLVSSQEARVHELRADLIKNSSVGCKLREKVKTIKVSLTGHLENTCKLHMIEKDVRWNKGKYPELSESDPKVTIFLDKVKKVQQEFSFSALGAAEVEKQVSFDFANLSSTLTVQELNGIQLKKKALYYNVQYQRENTSSGGFVGALESAIAGSDSLYNIYLCEVMTFSKALVSVNGTLIYENSSFTVHNLPALSPQGDLWTVSSKETNYLSFATNPKYYEYLRDTACEQTN